MNSGTSTKRVWGGSPACRFPSGNRACRRRRGLLRIYAEIVEVGNRIGHRPQAEPAGPAEGLIVGLQNAAMVDVDLETGATHRNFENVPGIRLDVVRHGGGDRQALAI